MSDACGANTGAGSDDGWAALADSFVEGAYATEKGRVRIFVLHNQLLRHLPAPPATVLDVGGGAANPSLPLARLGYQVTLLDALCACVEPGGVVSVMALNAATMAVRPALEHRWTDALAGFDATHEIGVLGAPTRADTVDVLSELLRVRGVEPQTWYGVWLFTDWLHLPVNGTDVEAVAAVELEASLRDPYRSLSRVFHLIGRHEVT